MLHEMAKKMNLTENLKGISSWQPFPKYGDRDGWNAISDDVKKEWIDVAQKNIDFNWPSMRTSLYLNIKRRGETFIQWQQFMMRRALLGTFLLAECMEGKGFYMDQIVDGIIAICEETSWVQGMDMRYNNFVLPDETANYVELCSTETAQLFAWIVYMMGDELDAEDAAIRSRMNSETLRRVIRPYLDRSDYWWMGYESGRINNWNPWCNMNVIQAAVMMDYPAELKAEVIEKLTDSLDIFIERYPEDGACDEGPGYWTAAGQGIAKCIDLLRQMTKGELDGSGIEKLSNIGTYFSKVNIHDNWFVNYADGDARLHIPSVVYRFGKLIKDERLMGLGAMAPMPKPKLDIWFQIYDYLVDIFDEEERNEFGGRGPYIERSYFSDCQILCAREKDGSSEGFFLSAKAGNNVESHNHNDVGSFIIFLDGKPLFIDLGTEEYSAKTFSPQRFEIWYNQSQYHNCPTINGVMQHDGKEYYATNVHYETDENDDRILMDIAPAYTPDAKVKKWNRSVELQRGGKPAVVVVDDYELNTTGISTYNFVTRDKPVLKDNYIVIDCGDGSSADFFFDAEALDVEIEEIIFEDLRLQKNWGPKSYRIVLAEKANTDKQKRIFRIERS